MNFKIMSFLIMVVLCNNLIGGGMESKPAELKLPPLEQLRITGDGQGRDFRGLNVKQAINDFIEMRKRQVFDLEEKINLRDAMLGRVDLSDLDLSAVRLNLDGALCGDVNFANTKFEFINAKGTNFARATFANNILHHSDFERADFSNAIFTNVAFLNSRLKRTNFSKARMDRVNFEGSYDHANTNLSQSICHDIHIVDSCVGKISMKEFSDFYINMKNAELRTNVKVRGLLARCAFGALAISNFFKRIR